MKTVATMFAMLAALAVGGKAMACGGGSAAGKLGRGLVQKIYARQAPATAARNAAAGAMTKVIKSQDSSGPTVFGRMMRATLLNTTVKTKLYSLNVNDPNGEVTGSAKVSIKKVTGGLQATIKSGKVDASW